MANNKLLINEKISYPQLKALVGDFKQKYGTNKGPEALNAVANELVFRSRVIVPVQLSEEPEKDGSVLSAKPGTHISFVLLKADDKSYLPVFTENEELDKWSFEGGKPEYTIVLDFNGLASIFEQNSSCTGLVINPFTDNLMVQREMLLKWSEEAQIKQHGHARHTITPDTPTEVYQLSPYPMLMSNKLCETAKKLPGVNAMWLRGIKLNGDNGFLLICDLSEDGNKGIFKALGDCATPMLEGKALHIVTFDSDFGKKSAENVLPFYTKSV